MHDTNDPMRRLHPRIFDTDWLMLRGMTRILGRLIDQHIKPGDVVLDFGCGNMPYRTVVEQRGATYLGADFGGEAANGISAEGRLGCANASVDVCLSLQVLEHVRDLKTYFSEIDRVLRPGGVLLLSTHGTWLYHPHPEDHRRWTRPGLVHDIESHGFKVLEIESIVGPLGTTTMIRLTGFVYFLRRIPIIGGPVGAILAVAMNLRGWLEELITPHSIRHDNGCVYLAHCERIGK